MNRNQHSNQNWIKMLILWKLPYFLRKTISATHMLFFLSFDRCENEIQWLPHLPLFFISIFLLFFVLHLFMINHSTYIFWFRCIFMVLFLSLFCSGASLKLFVSNMEIILSANARGNTGMQRTPISDPSLRLNCFNVYYMIIVIQNLQVQKLHRYLLKMVYIYSFQKKR